MEVVALMLSNIKCNGFNWILSQISNGRLKTHGARMVMVLRDGLEGRRMFHFEAKTNFLLSFYNFD